MRIYIKMANKKFKTNKSASKRFKISGTGKISHRHVKLNHFNSKASGNIRRNKRGQKEISKDNIQDIKYLFNKKII